MTDDDWANQRLAELHAAAPAKLQKPEPFARIALPVAAKVFAAMNCPKAMVWVWLVHQSRKTGKHTVVVPNGALARYGVSRDVKSSALRQLEAAGWITVKRSTCKNPIVTIVSKIADRTVGD
jgi:hypothetical protein